jgi:hypothetical protein
MEQSYVKKNELKILTTARKRGGPMLIIFLGSFSLVWLVFCPEAEFLDVIPPCYSQLPLLMDFTPPPASGLKLVCNINMAYGNLKPENSQDYAQKPQRNCTFMNSASGWYASSNTRKSA